MGCRVETRALELDVDAVECRGVVAALDGGGQGLRLLRTVVVLWLESGEA